MIKRSSAESWHTPQKGSVRPDDDNRSEPHSGDVSDAIKRRLKDLYDKVVTEPVPDKHRKLLEELEQKQKAGEVKPGR
jgi:hypothetical protein